MKKSISILLCCVMILSCTSSVFASATSWDTSDQANLQAIKNALTQGSSSVWGYLSTIANRLTYNNKSIANIAQDIYNLIQNTFYYNDGGNHSIAWWIHDMDVTISQALGSNGYLPQINNALTYTDGDGNVGSWLADIWQQEGVYLPNLDDLSKSLTNFYNGQSTLSQANRRTNGHQNFFSSSGNWDRKYYNGTSITTETFQWQNGTPLGNIFGTLRGIGDSLAYGFYDIVGGNNDGFRVYDDPTDYTSVTAYTNASIKDILVYSVEPMSQALMRLSYVLASDERMEAQEAAAANEQAVVDNFIDSQGDGAASPQDMASVSDLSSGFKTTYSTQASPSGIFNIFTSSNMGWFSSETLSQLDTTTSRRSNYPTPLLDQQISDIYNALGGEDNDR